MKKRAAHIPYYLPLFALFFVTIVGFAAFPHNRQFQSNIVISVSVAYVVWGFLYHFLHRDLSLTIIFEYIIVAAIGLASALSILNWG